MIYPYAIIGDSDQIFLFTIKEPLPYTEAGYYRAEYPSSNGFFRITNLPVAGQFLALDITGNVTAFKIIATPSAPLNLSGQVVDGRINLSWQSPSDNGGAALTCYKIYRSNGTSTSCINTTTGIAWTDATVQAGTTYSYVVTAVNSLGEGPFSNQITFVLEYPAQGSEPTNTVEGFTLLYLLASMIGTSCTIAYTIRRQNRGKS